MTKAEGSAIRGLPKELRDQTRRGEILDAASHCVVRHGFHGASMAEIAQDAAMSVGQIYRYFPSKEAIVHALVERIVERRLQWIDAHTETRADLPRQIAQRLAPQTADDSREEQVLMLEVMAEATRSPDVATILHEADHRLRDRVFAVIRRACPEFSDAQLLSRLELIAVLAEGTALRRVTGVTRGKKLLADLYSQVLESALAAPAR